MATVKNSGNVAMKQILRELHGRRGEMVKLLGEFVRCESPSHVKRAVDECGEIVARVWRRRGAKVGILRQAARGNHVRAEIWDGPGRASGQIMVLGHLDTVYPLGTLAKMPFRVAGGRAWGPGTFDMKGGLVLALFAVDALRALGIRPKKRLVFLWTSDEEIGSESSRRAIEQEARRSDAVLVLEPSFGREGRLKTQRKGVGGAEILVTGRSAHAGIDPEKGVNAVHELAHQIARLMKMNDRAARDHGADDRGERRDDHERGAGTRAGYGGHTLRAGGGRAGDQSAAAFVAADIAGRAGIGARRGGSSATRAHCGGAEIVWRCAIADARDGIAARGSVHGRRVGRKFYGGVGRADFGWVGRGGGWSA